jgi:hypothetical protein
VIRIRYGDLPAGLHIRVVARGKDTIIYMLPGLTAAQRQAALRRARSSGRMGQGPRVPVVSVAGALAVDRVRTTVRNGAAAIRTHPAMFIVPLLLVLTAAVAYMLLTSVSIKVREPQASGPGGSGAPIAAAVPPPPGIRANDPGSRSAQRASPGKAQRPASKRGGGDRGTGTSPSPSGSPAPSPTGTTPAPSPPVKPSPTPTPTRSPGGGSTGSSGSSSGGPCLGAGPLTVCLSL